MVIAVTASALFLALLFIDMFIDIFITAATKLVVSYGMRTVGDVVPGVVVYLRHLHYHSSLVGRVQWAHKWTDSGYQRRP